MEAFTVNRTGDKIQVTLDARHFKEDAVARLLNRLYIEYLAQRVNLGEDIETLGEEIKRDWWQQNKARILAKIHEKNGNP
ncbi:MAG: hypothetical protein L6Q97_13855 [Thermoanaerobaculia bacterium]|nr:hypothetical protein [Thermoanaerobaculia bacterium]